MRINAFSVDFINNSQWLGQAFQYDLRVWAVHYVFTADNERDPYFATWRQSTNDLGQTVLSFFGTDDIHPGILPCNRTATATSLRTYVHVWRRVRGAIHSSTLAILVDVIDAQHIGDSFTAQGIGNTRAGTEEHLFGNRRRGTSGLVPEQTAGVSNRVSDETDKLLKFESSGGPVVRKPEIDEKLPAHFFSFA